MLIINKTTHIFVGEYEEITSFLRVVLVLRGKQEGGMKSRFKKFLISGKKMLAVENKTNIVGNCGAKWSLVGKGKDASFIAKLAMN
ncbi:MAG: hypothetical protein JHD09_11460 [Gemmataceae bacterium]|nr:hypothetical protein [Gemmataceae bacterium]MBJ7345882.1 hypothetical protein [Gemmataceae bacterium]